MPTRNADDAGSPRLRLVESRDDTVRPVAERFGHMFAQAGYRVESAGLDDGAWLLSFSRGRTAFHLTVHDDQPEIIRLLTEVQLPHKRQPDDATVFILLSAIMASTGFVRVFSADPRLRSIAFAVDAAVPSPEYLARHLEAWLDLLEQARLGFETGMATFAGVRTTRGAHRKTAAKDARTSDPAMYRLKVTLRGSDPPIWRRFEVAGDTKLPKLHRILQAVMGWTDSHLHAFRLGKIAYGQPDPDFPDTMRSERNLRLRDLVTREGAKFLYDYDFGDGWEHEVQVEHIGAPQPGIKYPRVLDGVNSAPPEDVGGISGYAEFLEALHDQHHERHDDMLQWIGGEFDPRRFDALEVQRRLTRLR